MRTIVAPPTVAFSLPPELHASAPPERRGVARDRVRLLVVDRRTGAVSHSRFDRLDEQLRPGDLLVLNASRTLPAALRGVTSEGGRVEVRLAERRADGKWLALALCGELVPCGREVEAGLEIDFGGGLGALVEGRDAERPWFHVLAFSVGGERFVELVYRLGSPVRYEYVASPWPLEDYQTVYAGEPGSAEMPSAGRAFTWERLLSLRRAGIATTSIVLHTSLSSSMDDEIDALHAASEEEYAISEAAAEAVARTRRNGGRVVAVGTTVVRALESAAARWGEVRPGRAYTRLRITASHELRAVDGLLTGLHEPYASHLDLLTAFLPPAAIEAAYAEAVERRYLWHEFGDLNLIV